MQGYTLMSGVEGRGEAWKRVILGMLNIVGMPTLVTSGNADYLDVLFLVLPYS